MSAVLEAQSPAELNAALSREVIEYLEQHQEAPAEDVIAAVRSGHQFLPAAPIVAAIWSLASQNLLEVRGDWTVVLRRRSSTEHAAR